MPKVRPPGGFAVGLALSGIRTLQSRAGSAKIGMKFACPCEASRMVKIA